MMTNNPIVFDLFSGAGGLSLGAVRAGFTLGAVVENDERALATHARNFPNSSHLSYNLLKSTGQDILSGAGLRKGQVTGVIGGPPCQGFSSIGKREINDDRNLLFSRFFTIIKDIEPDFFLVENVPGLLGQEYEAFLSNSLKEARKKYNVLGPFILYANEFGAPTTRKRAFFIGIKTKLSFSEKNFSPEKVLNKDTLVKDSLKGLPGKLPNDWRDNPEGIAKLNNVQLNPFLEKTFFDCPDGLGSSKAKKLLWDHGKVLGHIPTKHSHELILRYDALKARQQDPATKSVRLDPKGFCPTLRAGTNSDRGSFQAVRPIHPKYPRVITPREAARLQSFPDWFEFDRTKWHSFRQIGNSVPPILAEAILRPLYNFFKI